MRSSRIASAVLFAFAAAASACGGSMHHAPSAFEPLRAGAEVLPQSAGLRGPRLVPESVALDRTFGVEPGGGVRGIAAGVRVVSFASGAVVAANDRLGQLPAATVVLPERFGGGVLFAIGDVLWRAERWLARAEPIFRAPGMIRSVWVGLDRVYVRLPSGAVAAVDPTSGLSLDLGALPPSPSVTAFAALDGFRAVALADLRGVVATTDAGATWRTLALPIEPKVLALDGETVTVTSGKDVFEVRPEGDFGRVDARARKEASDSARTPGTNDLANTSRTFGSRPLSTAVTDGVPLADGTVLVARDGALARVRLADGAIVDLARDAYPLRPSRCHGIPMGESGAGFVCGEPQGRTHVYSYSPSRRVLELAMAFDSPRVVLPGGTGAVAVRGRCAEDAANVSPVPGIPATEMTYCIRDAAGAEREQVLTSYVESARVVALKDGTLAVIAPPRGDLTSGHITLASKSGAKTARIVFDGDVEAARRVLSQGMWLDGFEERAPGVLGGWVEHSGTMLGVEVRLDGHARHGAFVRDAGSVVVSGRYGLGWTSAQRGYETVDGGMTWRAIELPEPIAPKFAANARGCSSIGCVLEGWIRVGYGDASAPAANPSHTLTMARMSAVPTLELSCDVVTRGRGGALPVDRRTPLGALIGIQPLASRSTVSEFTPFYGAPPPALHAEEVGTTFDVQELVDHARPGLLARAYVWGAKGIEWDTTARWSVRWTSPFASSSDVFASAPSKPPQAVIEAARFAASAGTMRALSSLTLAASDDPRHALLVASRAGGQTQPIESFVMMLDDGRAPMEVKRADGEPFARIDGAVRHEGRWFLLAEPDAGEPAAAVVWDVEAGVAREVARVPRVLEGNARPSTVRLAKREGEGLLGLVVDGQPEADRPATTRWVLAIDIESGRAPSLEAIGTSDFGGKGLTACGGDEGGWVVDLPLGGQPIRATIGGKSGSFKAAHGRVRMQRDKACVERLTAVYDGSADDLARTVPRAGPSRTVEVGLLTGVARQELRCGK